MTQEEAHGSSTTTTFAAVTEYIQHCFAEHNSRLVNLEKCIHPLSNLYQDNTESIAIITAHIEKSMGQEMVTLSHVEDLVSRYMRLEQDYHDLAARFKRMCHYKHRRRSLGRIHPIQVKLKKKKRFVKQDLRDFKRKKVFRFPASSPRNAMEE